METNDKKKKFDMLDYIGNGKTMYDILDSYLGKYLHGDFSNESLINHSRTFADDFPSQFSSTQKYNAYQPALIKLMLNLEESLNPQDELGVGVKRALSEDEKSEILEKIKAIDPSKSISSIEQAMDLLRNNNFQEQYYNENGFYSKLNEIIVAAALDVSTDQSVMEAKQVVLKFVLLAHVSNALKAKYPNRFNEYTPEWEEFDFISRTLTDSKKLSKYDEFLRKYNMEMQKMEEKGAVAASCKAKRERYIIEALVSGMTEDEIEKVSKCKTVEEVIFERPETIPLKDGSYSWQIKQYSQPVLLLDKIAEYAPNANENQRVIAISYGKFYYETMFNNEGQSTVSADNLELIGVTRIGVDGSKSYFVLAPTMQASLKRIFNIDQKDVNITGVVGTIGEDNIEKRLFLVRESGIPADLENFYATVVFSNECLEAAINNNFRYVGEASMLDETPRLTARYKGNEQDIEAACYASQYPGRVGNNVFASLDRFCNTPELLCEHFETINKLPAKVVSRKIEYIDLSRIKEIADLVNGTRKVFESRKKDTMTTKKLGGSNRLTGGER